MRSFDCCSIDEHIARGGFVRSIVESAVLMLIERTEKRI